MPIHCAFLVSIFVPFQTQGAQYESTIIFLSFEIYNVNYKGEVGTWYLRFREKNNFYFPVSDTAQLAQNRSSRKGQQLSSPSAPVHWKLSVQLILPSLRNVPKKEFVVAMFDFVCNWDGF
jgi:hypothetical protein